MKVLTIAATPFFSDRGCHIRIYNEAKYLQKRGAEVFVCTYHLGNNIDGLAVSRIQPVRWYTKLSPGFAWGKVWLDFKLLLLCLKEIRRFQPDVIHAHLYEGLAIGYLAKLLTRSKTPILFDLQGNLEDEMESYNQENSFAKKFFSCMSKRIARLADQMVISSDRMLGPVQLIYNKSIDVIKDGVDLEMYRLAETKEPSMNKKIRDWKGNSKVLVYTGSMEESKGVGALLREFIAMRPSLHDWKLLLVGHGNALQEYQMFVTERKLEESILFTGHTSYFDLPHYLSLADLAIDPKTGTTESSGKLVNYMAAQLPVICYENEFNKGFLKDKGLYINDISALRGALEAYGNKVYNKNQYDLSELDEQKEAGRLYSIMHDLMR